MSDSFEHLLARTEHRGAAPPGSCPDAEVLAAYLDATLTPPERAAVEAHAADCARCALQLATVVRLEDVSGNPQQAPARGWRPRLAWMVPTAMAVVVAAVYVALPSSGVRRATPPQTVALQDGVERKELEPSNPEALKELLEQSQYRVVPPTGTPVPSATSVPSAARAPAPQTDAPPRENERAATHGASAANAAARDAARTQGELHRRVEGQPAAPRQADTPIEAPPEAQTETLAELRAPSRADVQSPLVVRSPDARVQWRVVGDRIERSTDAGRTWGAEPAPAPDALTMGAAPSAEVCWLAGASGQVLRRAEDGHWADVSPAPRLTIVRLDVSTALDAAAIGGDGTTVKTADGGRTWMR